ncbi:type VI secretion system-associated FHA domain protein TagH [Sulfitobacter sp. JBTF-M27]|uniref:Type VI secretion system-associated FHA domain protein TagH n=1 Tax=Sulfitobacter sediminilitoris TaxID=2698830 RepID=A0A6P0CCW3_9RHOB|nr:type VI secretion system-associated FHA domain protein TagH [Sulfitobacter sediminilitoris]NEK24081.1 type VI secretion system-associated FHA domain protein TagH [Sulfitobacter sediminilitoris]
MPVKLTFQSSGTMPGDVGLMQMPAGGSLSLGRGPANDLVLPDPERQLSKSHCVIEDHNGNVVVVDLSTNGTFLNYSKTPLGRTPTPLNNGDILSVGPYELMVEIADASPPSIPDPVSNDPVSHGQAGNSPNPMQLLDDVGPGGDFLEDLLGSPEGPKGPGQIKTADPIDDLLPPLGEEEDPFFTKPSDASGDDPGPSQSMHNTSSSDSFRPSHSTGPALIPDDWDDDLLAPSTPDPEPKPEPVAKEEPPPQPAAPLASNDTKVPAPQAAAVLSETAAKADVPPAKEEPVVVSGDQAAARAFLDALDVEELQIADEDLHTAMSRMGRVMRTMITGLREILMTRTSIKSEFRIEQTMISAGGNNPLKFSISPEQAIEALVKPKSRGYLGSETATEQALNDIKAHEVAMVTGMEAALKGVLAKLDPEVLGEQIESGGGIGGLLKGKKARYWEVYEKMYGQISDQAENDFHELFSREFARAYKEQLDKLK